MSRGSWNKTAFLADERTLSQIYENHHKKLYGIRTGRDGYKALDNHGVSSQVYGRKAQPKMKSIWSKAGRKRFDEYSEVRECYRRTKESRSQKHRGDPHWGVDHSEPVSMKIGSRIRHSNSKKAAYERNEHLNNIRHMKRRIREQDSLRERRKTPYDTTVYPALIRRRPASRAASHNGRPMSSTMPSISGTTRGKQGRASRPQTAKPQPPKSPRGPPQSARRRRPAPVRYTAPPSEYRAFREDLIDTIVSSRMYRQSDLNALFRRKVIVNESLPMHSRLDPQRVNNIISDLVYELELDTGALSSDYEDDDDDYEAAYLHQRRGEDGRSESRFGQRRADPEIVRDDDVDRQSDENDVRDPARAKTTTTAARGERNAASRGESSSERRRGRHSGSQSGSRKSSSSDSASSSVFDTDIGSSSSDNDDAQAGKRDDSKNEGMKKQVSNASSGGKDEDKELVYDEV